MTTHYAPRTHTLQQTVLDYFASFAQEAVVHTQPGLPAALDVELSGQLATRFEAVSLPLPGTPARRRLRLLFNREYAAVAPDYELVAPGSPVLRIMLNDLAGGAPFTRSALLLNVAGDFSDLAAVGLQVRNATPEAVCRYLPRRFFQVRYLVRLLSYEKTEDVVPVFLDGQTLQALPEDRAAQLIGSAFGDLGTAAYRKELATGPADPELVRKAIAAADQAVQAAVRASLRERFADLERQLDEERQRTVQHFEGEFKNAATPAQRQDLERLKAQKMQELKDRYQVRTEVALLSVQELIAPQVEYRLRVRKGGGLVEVPNAFVIDPLAADDGGGLLAAPCPACQERKVWIYCGQGNHLECGHCGKVEKCHAAGCDGAACATHTVHCGRCPAVICPAHARACQYCPDGTRYCDAHTLKSAEGKAICHRCARPCAACARIHPAGQLVACSVCQRPFCGQHVRECPACKKPHCQEHSGRAVGRAETFCTGCLGPCVECDTHSRHLLTDLKRCEACPDSVCTKHSRRCATCHRSFCRNHIRALHLETRWVQVIGGRLGKRKVRPESGFDSMFGPIVGGRRGPGEDDADPINGCVSCFPGCATCGMPEPAELLERCPHCPPQGPERHCVRHACVACNTVVCDQHAVPTAQGRGCVTCFGPCVVCRTQYHRKADLIPCAECAGPVCAAHAVRSQFANEPYCVPHVQALFAACPGCGLQGPARLFFICPCCNVRYGPCCRASAPGQPCRHCRDLEPYAEPWRDTLRWTADVWEKKRPAVSATAARDISRALAGGSAGGFALSLGQTRGHVLVRGEYKAGAFDFLTRYFRETRRFVVVVDKADFTVRVRVNP